MNEKEFLVLVTRPFARKIQLRWDIELIGTSPAVATVLKNGLSELRGVEAVELKRYSAWLDIADWVTNEDTLADDLRNYLFTRQPPALAERLAKVLGYPFLTVVTVVKPVTP